MLTLAVWSAANVNAQVAIGTGTGADGGPVDGAVLELNGAQGAFLLPRVDTLDITTPVAGMQIYRPADNQVYTYNDTKWITNAGDATKVLPGTATNQSLVWNGSSWVPRRLPYMQIWQTGNLTSAVSWQYSQEQLNSMCNTGMLGVPVAAEARNACCQRSILIRVNSDSFGGYVFETIDRATFAPSYLMVKVLCL